MYQYNHLHSGYKVLFALLISAVFFLTLLPDQMEVLTRIMVSWDIFSLSVIIIIWITIVTMPTKEIRTVASSQDEGRIAVFILLLISTLCSLGAVLILLKNKGRWVLNKDLETMIYISAVFFAWFLMHTIFTLRYAHLYYDDDDEIPEQERGGLIFPEEKNPDYIDFAYFSFVIGMTFQVSDVNISGRVIRRSVLLHGILSFVFNTVIVALTINVIFNMTQG